MVREHAVRRPRARAGPPPVEHARREPRQLGAVDAVAVVGGAARELDVLHGERHQRIAHASR